MSRPCRRSVLLCIIVACASGCRLSPGGKTAVIAGGVGASLGGVMWMNQGPVDSDGDGSNEWLLNDNLGAYMGGSVLLMMGLGMLIAGLVADTTEPTPRMFTTAAVMPVAPPPSVTAFAPPSSGSERAALPELPATPEVLRLGQQIRSAASRGDCDGAWHMLTMLDALDNRYAEALRNGAVMAPCAGAVSTSTMR
jgi:hypothetical protein